MNLSAQNVDTIFKYCLFKEGEPRETFALGDGVMMKVGFNPERLWEKTDDIKSMLAGLPDSFQSVVGGGDSFLNMCMDKEGSQWADLHLTMDQLVCLGRAINKIDYHMPREDWGFLPAGMPFLVIGL